MHAHESKSNRIILGIDIVLGAWRGYKNNFIIYMIYIICILVFKNNTPISTYLINDIRQIQKYAFGVLRTKSMLNQKID